jgi:hypothetical protein
MDVNDEHPAKQLFSILVTEFGIIIDEHPSKQLYSISLFDFGIVWMLMMSIQKNNCFRF